MALSLLIVVHFAFCNVVTAYHDTCKSATHPLVSGVDGVPNYALTASSIWGPSTGPHRARLHTYPDAISPHGAWCPKGTDMIRPWIQVQFNEERTVEKIQTQGRSDYTDFVRKYKISTSKDCITFTYYKESGQVKVFNGNYDRNTVVQDSLKYPRIARCVRIHVLQYQRWPCLRFDILGRKNTCKSATHPLVSGSDGVPNYALTASSIWGPSTGPHRGRLHTYPDAKSPHGAWCPQGTDKIRPWIQVQFKEVRTVEKIQTQGRADHTDFVRKYKISTSKNCVTFAPYKENGQVKVFIGNYDRNTIVTQSLKYPQVARCVRIHVLQYQRWPCLRFEILGGNSKYGH